MSQKRRLYLICYDIANPQRLARVSRFLCRHAYRVQYSVFAIETTRGRVDDLLEKIAALINSGEDDVRAYPLPRQGEAALLGTQMFPADILLIRDGRNLFRLETVEPEKNPSQLPKDRLREGL